MKRLQFSFGTFSKIPQDNALAFTVTYTGGGGGDRGVAISRFPYPVLPPPVPFCPFVSRLPPFIVFLPLSCKSRCLTPYSDSIRSALALSKIKNCVVIPTLRRTSTLALLRQRLYRTSEAPILLQYIRVAHKPITTLQRQGQRQTGGQTGSSIQDQMLRLPGFLHW